MTRLALIALAGYTVGLAIGTGICWAAWATASHETRYRIGAAL